MLFQTGSLDLVSTGKVISSLAVDLYVARFRCATTESAATHKSKCPYCKELCKIQEFAVESMDVFLTKLLETGQVNAIYYHNGFAQLYWLLTFPRNIDNKILLPFALRTPTRAQCEECATKLLVPVRVRAQADADGIVRFQHMASVENPFTTAGVKDDPAEDKILWVDRYAIPLKEGETYDLVGFRYPNWIWPRDSKNPHRAPADADYNPDTDSDLPDLEDGETCEDAE
jgi:hypothetical protein